MKPELQLPLKDVLLTQEFWKNFLKNDWTSFYAQFWLSWHPGLDFKSQEATVYAMHDGFVSKSLFSETTWNYIQIDRSTYGLSYWTWYMHLKERFVKQWDKISAGQAIGITDNTWTATTWEHLHIDFYESLYWVIIDRDNWYNGRKDPSQYICRNYQGILIKPSDAFKSNAYHRYFRKDRATRAHEIAVQFALAKYLKRLPTTEQLNACIYWAWDREYVANVAMRPLWWYMTKGDYLKWRKPFQNN